MWCAPLQFSGGARYLETRQSSFGFIDEFDAGGDLVASGSYAARTEFQGAGSTLGVTALAPIGHTGLSIFSQARASLLVGTGRSRVESDLSDVTGDTDHDLSRRSSLDSLVPMTEVELGFDYSTLVGSHVAFARVAAVNQTYFGLGNSTRGDGSISGSPHGNVSLFGMQISLGLNY